MFPGEVVLEVPGARGDAGRIVLGGRVAVVVVCDPGATQIIATSFACQDHSAREPTKFPSASLLNGLEKTFFTNFTCPFSRK